MRRASWCLVTVIASSLGAPPVLAAPVRGTVAVPDVDVRRPCTRHATYWRVENGMLRIAPPLRDPRTEMVVWLEGGKAPAAPPATVVVQVQGYRLDPPVIVIPEGGTVEFRNTGRSAHVLFDKQKVLTRTAIKPGQSRAQKYHAEGDYVIRDEEFPHLHGTVKVLSTPLFARPDPKGAFRIDNVPEGRWAVKLWHAGSVVATGTVDVGPKGGDVVLQVPPQAAAPSSAGKR